MKNNLLKLVAVCLLFLSQTTFSQSIPSYVPQNGLVGWWPFNGNANDESGNGNNGMVNGATLTTDRFGNADKAYSFDGVNDYILINNNSSLSSIRASLSVWVRLDTLASWFPNRYIITKGCNNPNTNNGGTYRILFDVKNYVSDNWTNNDNNSRVFLLSDNSYFDTRWANIIFTYDGSKNRLFVNGQLVDSANQTGNLSLNEDPLLFGTRLLSFTGSNCQLAQFFQGQLDDIAIWNRALSEQEIKNLYTGNVCNTPPPPPSYIPQNGLVGWWPFNGNANDESGNGNNGTVNGATLTTDRFGNAGKAYSFDGVNSKISLPVSTTRLNGDYAISLWYKLSSYSSIYPALMYDVGGLRLEHQTENKGIAYYMGIAPGNSGIVLSSPPNSTDIVSYVHLLINKNSSSTKMFFNGKLISSTLPIRPSNFSDSIIVGEIGSFQGYNGIIDDIALYSRALSDQEIKNLYNANICYQNVTVTDTLLINMNITSFNPITYENTIKIYPNPTQGNLTIDFGNISFLSGYQMKITNSVGQQVFQTNINQKISNVNLSSFSSKGIYYVQLIDSKGTIAETKKIVVQ